MYQRVVTERGSVIVTESDGVRLCFPEDEANADYQAYLAWVAEGNEPEVVQA